MTLNISKGNMYDWITRTFNPIRGECYHACQYCYVKSSRVKNLYTGKPHLVESAFKSLGKGHFYFVGSMIDMFAEDIPSWWIHRVLDHCKKYDNKYLFQTKNPQRICNQFKEHLPLKSVIGTTIETSYIHKEMGNTLQPMKRALAMKELSLSFLTMVTVEPIMTFSLINLSILIKMCRPEWVNIGADSKKHNLPEPSSGKIQALIDNLRGLGIEVKPKSNLKRLMK